MGKLPQGLYKATKFYLCNAKGLSPKGDMTALI
jgi:hypothetical protein